MAVATDNNSTFSDYAHPERLVSTQWLARQLADRPDGPDHSHKLVVIESDEDVLLYDTGHIPGAVKVDWHTDLNDQVTRDYVNGEQFARVLGERGFGRDHRGHLRRQEQLVGRIRTVGFHLVRS